MKQDIYERVNQKIMDNLEKGVVPWRKPWTGVKAPRSLNTKSIYTGINFFNLLMEQIDTGYSSHYWLTFLQCKKLGGKIKKGSHGEIVVYWNFIEKKEEKQNPKTGKIETVTKKIPFLRYYTVFNLDQTEGIPAGKLPGDAYGTKKETTDFEPLKECEKIIDGYKDKPSIDYRGTKACYKPKTDTVTIPFSKQFKSAETFYSVLFHELVHSTGRNTRLDRPGIGKGSTFGDHEYSKEELIAEAGAAYLCYDTGISPQTLENSTAYIDGWLKTLQNNKKWLVSAFGQAHKAVNYIKGIKEINEAANTKKAA